MMKTGAVLTATLFVALSWTFFFSGCTDHSGTEKKVIARINGLELSLDEFESKLAAEMEYNQSYKTTLAARETFLDTLVKKELLIQQAVSLGLDKETLFVDAMERYWEATLIKRLMENKSAQILKQTYVTDQEIRSHYQELRSQKKVALPLDQVEKKIARTLKHQKLTRIIDQWTLELKHKADIQINSRYL